MEGIWGSRVESIEEAVQVNPRDASLVHKVLHCKEVNRIINKLPYDDIFVRSELTIFEVYKTRSDFKKIYLVFIMKMILWWFNMEFASRALCEQVFVGESFAGLHEHVYDEQHLARLRQFAKNPFLHGPYTWSFGIVYSASSLCSDWQCCEGSRIRWRTDNFHAPNDSIRRDKLYRRFPHQNHHPCHLMERKKQHSQLVKWNYAIKYCCTINFSNFELESHFIKLNYLKNHSISDSASIFIRFIGLNSTIGVDFW